MFLPLLVKHQIPYKNNLAKHFPTGWYCYSFNSHMKSILSVLCLRLMTEVKGLAVSVHAIFPSSVSVYGNDVLVAFGITKTCFGTLDARRRSVDLGAFILCV